MRKAFGWPIPAQTFRDVNVNADQWPAFRASDQAQPIAASEPIANNGARRASVFRLVDFLVLAITASGVHAVSPSSFDRVQTAAARPGVPNACAILPRDEVRKHLTWPDFLDKVTTIEEERSGAGSACEYPSVRIQVLPFSPGVLDAERKKPQVESVAGVGDEAFFVPRVRQYAEMYVKSGNYLLTLQAGVPTGQTVDTMKPAVINLAKALVARLR